MRWSIATVFAFVGFLGGFAPSATAADEKLPPIPTIDLKRTTPIDYAKDVLPIFENKCLVCHSGKELRGKYDMESYAGVVKGGKRGAAVIPGKSEKSNIFLFCSRQKTPVMPPEKEDQFLSSRELTILKLWIDEGAKAPTTVREKVKVIVNLPPALVRPVRAVAVTADGKTVAAGRGNQIHLFDGKTGNFIKTLIDPTLKTPDGKDAKSAHISLVEALAFNKDGTTLASGSFEEMTLWDVEKGTPKKRIGGFADRVTAIAFSPDGKYLATGGGAPTVDGEVKIFDADGKPVGEIKNGHSDTVFGLAFSPDSKLLATASADKFVKVWEVPAGKHVKTFEGHTHHVMDVAWSPDGKKLISAGADNLVKLWDYEKGEKIKDLQGHQKQVTRVVFSGGKKPEFLTVSGDASLRSWTLEGNQARQFPNAATDYLYTVSASADGAVIATGCEDGVVRIYDGAKTAFVKAAVPPGAEGEAVKEQPKTEAPKKKRKK